MPPSDPDALEDLAYIRRAVERNRTGDGDPASWILWSVLVLVGFPLADLAPHSAGLYWLIAIPVGIAVTLWRGARLMRGRGKLLRRDLLVQGLLHWVGMLAAVAMLLSMVSMTPVSRGPAVMIIVALTYFLYGLHVSRRFLAFAAIVCAGAYGLHVLGAWAWTILGVVLASGFLLTAVLEIRRRPASDA